MDGHVHRRVYRQQPSTTILGRTVLDDDYANDESLSLDRSDSICHGKPPYPRQLQLHVRDGLETLSTELAVKSKMAQTQTQ